MKLKLIFLFVMVAFGLQAQCTLLGQVTEVRTGEPIIFGNVAIYQDRVLVTGAETDFDGNYRIEGLKAGAYEVEATYVGLRPYRIKEVILVEGKDNKLDIAFPKNSFELIPYCHHSYYQVPLYESDNMTSGQTFSKNQIKRFRN